MKLWVTFTSIALTLMVGAGVFFSHSEITEAALDPSAFKEKPCAQGFELSVAVHPVQDSGLVHAVRVNDTQNGFYLAVDKSGNGKAVRLSEKEKMYTFSKARCETWQKYTWPKLQNVIFQNGLKERSNFNCINVAELKYRVGNKKYVSKVCLGSPIQDGMSHGFREFYRGTEYLAW